MSGELSISQFRYVTTNGRDFVIGDPTDPDVETLSKYLVFQTNTTPGYSTNPHLRVDKVDAAWKFVFSENGTDSSIMALTGAENTFTEVNTFTGNTTFSNTGTTTFAGPTVFTNASNVFSYLETTNANIAQFKGGINSLLSTTLSTTTITGATTSAAITLASGNLVASVGNISATTGSITGASLVASTGNITATLGNIVASAGGITATLGTVTGVSIVASTGNITSTLGNINALEGTVTALNLTATGLISATDLTATDQVTAQHLDINDSVLYLNKGGDNASAVNSGLYVKGTADANEAYAATFSGGWSFKAPARDGRFIVMPSTANFAMQLRAPVLECETLYQLPILGASFAGATSYISCNYTPFAGDKALVSDLTHLTSGIKESSVTSTELGYLSGVTSAIQTQFTNANTYSDQHVLGYTLLGSVSESQVLTYSGGQVSWTTPSAGMTTSGNYTITGDWHLPGDTKFSSSTNTSVESYVTIARSTNLYFGQLPGDGLLNFVGTNIALFNSSDSATENYIGYLTSHIENLISDDKTGAGKDSYHVFGVNIASGSYVVGNRNSGTAISMWSPSGYRFLLHINDDGVLIIEQPHNYNYGGPGDPIWATESTAGSILCLRGDGVN